MLKSTLCNLCTRFCFDLYRELYNTFPTYKGTEHPSPEDLSKASRCPAFPDGILVDILSSDFIHFEKHHDQKDDIVFEFDNSGSPAVLEKSKNLLENFKKKYEQQKNRKK